MLIATTAACVAVAGWIRRLRGRRRNAAEAQAVHLSPEATSTQAAPPL
ncbi:hypothetical protein ACI2L1_09765 [Streptomyces sp. NPDC019531]